MRRGEIEEEEKELALHSARQLQEDPDTALPAQISTSKSLPEEWQDYKDDVRIGSFMFWLTLWTSRVF